MRVIEIAAGIVLAFTICMALLDIVPLPKGLRAAPDHVVCVRPTT